MARKKKHPEHVNHERWLISYADFITLLFAFFVVMFAVSQVDTKKLGRFTASFTDAMEWQVFNDQGGGALLDAQRAPRGVGSSIRGAEPAPRRSPSASTELSALRDELASGGLTAEALAGLEVLEERGEIVLRLPDRLLFETGSTSVNPAGRAAVEVVARILKDRHVDLRIEGHTDDRPIASTRYRSNWELAAGRATSVLEVMVAAGIEPARLCAGGYGEFRPVAANDGPTGRAKNRRVDIALVARREL